MPVFAAPGAMDEVCARHLSKQEHAPLTRRHWGPERVHCQIGAVGANVSEATIIAVDGSFKCSRDEIDSEQPDTEKIESARY